MSSRMFQSVIVQMKEATDRVIGVIDADGNVVSVTLNSNPNLSFLSMLWELLSPSQKAVRNAKSTALYNACENNEADQILGATFDYKITDFLFFTRVECTVKGFPASVRGVELQQQKPIILNEWQKIEYLSSTEEPKVYSGPEQSVSPGTAGK